MRVWRVICLGIRATRKVKVLCHVTEIVEFTQGTVLLSRLPIVAVNKSETRRFKHFSCFRTVIVCYRRTVCFLGFDIVVLHHTYWLSCGVVILRVMDVASLCSSVLARTERFV